jgi:hypothetical protein
MLVESSLRKEALNPEKPLSATDGSHDTPSPLTAISHATAMHSSMGWWRLWQASRSWGLPTGPLAEIGCRPRRAATPLTTSSPGFQATANHPVLSGRCWSNSPTGFLPASCGCGARFALSVRWPTLPGVTPRAGPRPGAVPSPWWQPRARARRGAARRRHPPCLPALVAAALGARCFSVWWGRAPPGCTPWTGYVRAGRVRVRVN